MGVEGLAQLVADAVARVQRAHRFLEDHADPTAAQAPHGALAQRQQVGSREQGLSARGPDAARQQADDGGSQHRLARPGLADDAVDLARPDVKREALDGEAPVAPVRERDEEVAHGEDGPLGAHAQRPRAPSETRSRRPSPNRLTASTIENRAAPGKAIIQKSKKR